MFAIKGHSMKQYFAMFAAYNLWANEQLYAAASDLNSEEWTRDAGAFFGSAMATLNHILVADRIWLKRFTGRGEAPTNLDELLYPAFADLRAARVVEDARIKGFIDDLDESALSGSFTYVTITDNRRVTQRLAPALAHVFNHQTHHRGQVHAILTTLGRPSAVLDLVYFHRTEAGRAFA